MATVGGSDAFYSGSRLLQPITELSGLPIDQVNFLVCQLVALALGFPFRLLLCPKTTSPTVRHAVEFLLGIALVLFCFGSQIWHLFAHASLGYVLMKYSSKKWMPQIVFVFAMGYLSVAHIYRMVLDYGGYTLDITGPLMVSVQKITSVAFAVHDGTRREEKDLTPNQKKHAVRSMPDVLTYFSYIFCFHGVMCGPLVFFNDYVNFIDGTCFKGAAGNESKNVTDIPSPVEDVLKKIVLAVILGVLMMIEPMIAPWNVFKDPEFLSSTTWAYRMVYLLVSMTMHRPMYYFAWKLGELVNNSSGLGFSGYDENGKAKWNLLNNVEIYKLEVSNSLKVNIDSWNVTTALWLRHTVYERVPPSIGTWAVFTISAFWHGFYPGYYVAFLTGALFTSAARLVRRNVRPYFLQSSGHKFFYDCVTFWFTRFANVYFVVPHVLLDFTPGLILYTSLFWWLHILAIGTIVYFNFIVKFVRPAKKEKTEKTN